MKRFLNVPEILRSAFGAPQQAGKPPQEADLKAAAEDAKNRGNQFLGAGNPDEAIRCFQEALRILPDYAEAFVNLGFVHRQQKRYADAQNALTQAVAIKPELWQAHFNLGIVLQELGRSEEALASLAQAIRLKPDVAECHWRQGNLLLEKQQYQQAAEAFQRALALDPNLAEIHTNLGTALLNLGRNNESLDHYRAALKIREHHVTHYLTGIACQKLLQWQAAMEHFQRAVDLAPDYAPAHYQLAFLLLLQGDYQRGLAHFEKRLALPENLEWLTPIREVIACFGRDRYWRGENLAGKRLLAITEQGLGDTLMMLRYLPLIKTVKSAATLRVVCDAPLARLVGNLPGVDEIIVKPANLRSDDCDRYCTTMSLPYLFGARLDNLPPAPYLPIPEQEKANWAKRLAASPGLKVGIAWAGNAKLDTDAIRSLPLRKLAPLMAIDGITWVNLQKGTPAGQIQELAWPMLDWMDECRDFQDSGALMENLDLIISVDTAVVHLAGALGRPTWLLNRHESEWRWLLERDVSPWYPSVRIFRQPTAGDWDSVIERMSSELRTLVRA